MAPENDRQKLAGKYALGKMLELANLMTDSGKKGRVLKNRVAANERIIAREIHISANPDVVRQCVDADMENSLVEMVREAFYRRKVRIFREGLKRLGKLHIFNHLEERVECESDAEYMRHMDGMIEDFLTELAPEKKLPLVREMGKVACEMPEACVCIRVTAGILDGRFSEAVLQAGIGRGAKTMCRKVAHHRALPSVDGVKKAIDAVLCAISSQFAPEASEEPLPAMRM